MRNYLKAYHVELTTLSPVFIGDGNKIGNKEYIYLARSHRILIPYLGRMFNACVAKKISGEYRNYMMGEKQPLGRWLQEQGFSEGDFEKWKKYELDAGDFFIPSNNNPGRTRPPQDIQTFVKDPYGLPYIPGSSIKGIIRTALVIYAVKNNPAKYSSVLNKIKEQSNDKKGRKFYLAEATSDLETSVFHTLEKNEKRKADAVNSVMAGLVISDSKPLSLSDLALCQKIDVSMDGQENRLNILKEALKPGVKIEFDISIDETLFPYSIEEIFSALNLLNEAYYDSFCKKFDRGDPQPGIIWIVGGDGFGTKTVINALFNEDEALTLTDKVMQVTVDKKYTEHHHDRDRSLGVSPHVFKCTKYEGQLYDFGKAIVNGFTPI